MNEQIELMGVLFNNTNEFNWNCIASFLMKHLKLSWNLRVRIVYLRRSMWEKRGWQWRMQRRRECWIERGSMERSQEDASLVERRDEDVTLEIPPCEWMSVWLFFEFECVTVFWWSWQIHITSCEIKLHRPVQSIYKFEGVKTGPTR